MKKVKMEEKPNVNLIFFSLFNLDIKIKYYKLSYDNNMYVIGSDKIKHEIPEDIFCPSKVLKTQKRGAADFPTSSPVHYDVTTHIFPSLWISSFPFREKM